MNILWWWVVRFHNTIETTFVLPNPSNLVAMANETTSTIPASWFREQAMYDFEKRAIVSKHWILITHKNRFTKAGDYLTFSMAGISFIVIRDRSGDINSFLNVCRHRAFPLLQKEEGTASILSCKYHGELPL